MTEQEIKQACDQCNKYINDNYHSNVVTFEEMVHVTVSKETLRYNPGCDREWAVCGIKQASIKVQANVVYRRNGTSANTSLRVEVRHFPSEVPGLQGWQENTCLAGIKFNASLKWPTIQKKLDSMIAVARDSQGLICVPQDRVEGMFIKKYTQDAAVATRFAEDNRDILLKYGRTVEENLRKELEQISKYLGGRQWLRGHRPFTLNCWRMAPGSPWVS